MLIIDSAISFASNTNFLRCSSERGVTRQWSTALHWWNRSVIAYPELKYRRRTWGKPHISTTLTSLVILWTQLCVPQQWCEPSCLLVYTHVQHVKVSWCPHHKRTTVNTMSYIRGFKATKGEPYSCETWLTRNKELFRGWVGRLPKLVQSSPTSGHRFASAGDSIIKEL